MRGKPGKCRVRGKPGKCRVRGKPGKCRVRGKPGKCRVRGKPGKCKGPQRLRDVFDGSTNKPIYVLDLLIKTIDQHQQ